MDLATHLTAATRAALPVLAQRLRDAAWDKAGISQAFKQALTETGLKMPQLAPAVRVLVCGRSQTPSIDAVLGLFPREKVLERIGAA